MASPAHPRIIVIGVGNLYRSDDAAGIQVVRRLRETGFNSATVLEHSGEGAALVEAWQDADAVILIDAVSSGAEPGTLYRFEPLREQLKAAHFHHSTHALGIPQAIALGSALNRLPARMVVFGIEGRNFQAGTDLSLEVADILPAAASRVIEEVNAMLSTAKAGE